MIAEWVYWAAGVTQLLLGFACAGHALINKRDPRAALGWSFISLTVPLFGPLTYVLFGINRIRRRAKEISASQPMDRYASGFSGTLSPDPVPIPDEYQRFEKIGNAVTERPLTHGNSIEALHNGEQAYEAMLAEIERAMNRVWLASYILDTDKTGKQFISTLGNAAKRNIDVRVLVDGIGQLYSLPPASRKLKHAGVDTRLFLPPHLWPPSLHLNLRNHRKILLSDNSVAFTGGMNIGDRHIAKKNGKRKVIDMHFRLQGPIVNQLADVFCEDWLFASGHSIKRPISTEPAPPGSQAWCRVISDGPDEDLDKLSLVIEAAVSAAQTSIYIMTPYFLPSRELISALMSAAIRGVNVNIVLPAKNNLFYVHWATRNMLWELLQQGVRIYYQPAPFVHTKLLLVDRCYAHIGSANLDPRSLRLNFELVVEVMDTVFSDSVSRHFDEVISRSREVTLDEMDGRALPIKLRDAVAWLFSPYL